MSDYLRRAPGVVRIGLLAFVLATGAVAATQAFDYDGFCGDEDCNPNNPYIECESSNSSCGLNPGGLYTKCCSFIVN